MIYASAAGDLAVGMPPRAELAHFWLLPQLTEKPDDGREAAHGPGAGHAGRPHSRPFSSHSPRMSVPQPSHQRPHTALPFTSSGWGANGGSGTGQGSAAVSAPFYVRLLHRPSSRYLHIDAATGAASLQPQVEPQPSNVYVNGRGDGDAGRAGRPPLSQLSTTFELLLRHAPPAQRGLPSAPPAHALSHERQPAMRLLPAPEQQQRTLGQHTARKPATLASKRFDMATGSVRDTGEGPMAWTSALDLGHLGGHLGEIDGGGLSGVDGSWSGREPDGGCFGGGGGGAFSAGAPPQPVTAATLRGDSRAAGAARPPTGVFQPTTDSTRQTAWEPSQLDLKDMMAGGPLVLRSLFAAQAPPPDRGAQPAARHEPRAAPPSAPPSSHAGSASICAASHLPSCGVSDGYATAGVGIAPPTYPSGCASRPGGRGARRGAPRFQTRIPNPGLRGLP